MTEEKKETNSTGKDSPIPNDDSHRTVQYMEVSNHQADHVTSKSKTTDSTSYSSKVIDQSESKGSNDTWSGHVTDHVTHQTSHERLSRSFQQVPPEQGHMTFQHRPPKDHMTPQADHVTSKSRKDVLQNDLYPPNPNHTDHMTPGHMTHPHTKKKTSPSLGGAAGAREIPLDPLIGFVKHSKSEQPSFNQTPVSSLFSPPPSIPTPPSYSKHYLPVSSSPAQFTNTLTPPLSATEVVHTSSNYTGKTSQSYESPLGQSYQHGPMTSISPSLQQYGSQQQGPTTRHHSITASPHFTSPQTQSPSMQYVNTHHGTDYHTVKDTPPPRTSHYTPGPKQQQSQHTPSNHSVSQPLQHASPQYLSSLKHQQHASSASQPILQSGPPYIKQHTSSQSSPPYIKQHTSSQFTASPQHKQLASGGSQHQVGVHQSSPLLHGMPQLRHMGTLPSADSVLNRSYPSPSTHVIDSPNVARGSPSQPGSSSASHYQMGSLSLLHQQQQQAHTPGLIPQQFPQVYSSSPPQRQLHHQLQQQQFAPNDLVLHQYGYSTLSPEAILRQKLLQQQQQTGPGSVNFSPLSHPQTHHSPVVMGGGPSPMQYNPRPINVYQYQPPSSVSPPTAAPGHLNYIHHHHHHHMHKNPNGPHQ